MVAIVDHTKIGDNSIASFASVEDIDLFISDEDINQDLKKSL